jgi:hypothetical protein
MCECACMHDGEEEREGEAGGLEVVCVCMYVCVLCVYCATPLTHKTLNEGVNVLEL